MRNSFLLLLLFVLFLIISGFIIQPTEFFSFKDDDGRRYALINDADGAHILFVITHGDSLEMMYPTTEMFMYDSLNSWEAFRYSHYFRGGGQENAGLDLNFVYFTHDSVRYVLYNNYSAEENEETFGLKIMYLMNDSTIDINGEDGTRQGNLIQFRAHEWMQKGEETFY